MRYTALALAVAAVVAIWAVVSVSGDGSFMRLVTISGVYSVCRPDGYDVVCFLDADGPDGGMFCLPLKDLGGECRK